MTGRNKIGQPLDNMKRDNPFKVPDGYFDQFSEKLRDRISTGEPISIPVKKVLGWKPYLAAAITILIALVAGSYAYLSQSGARAEKRLHAEIMMVVEQELYSISEETIREVMESKSLPLSDARPGESDEVIDYLLNEDIQDDELMNAL